MARLTFRVPDDLAERFSTLARDQGGSSAVLRRLIEEKVRAAGAPAPSRDGTGLPAIDAALGPSTKVTIRFREQEAARIAALAASRGMSRTQWVTSLVRARLGVEHPQTGDERAALRAIARELNRIGGNVNQIARVANLEARSGRPASVDSSSLAEVREAIVDMQDVLRQVLGRSAGYWDDQP